MMGRRLEGGTMFATRPPLAGPIFASRAKISGGLCARADRGGAGRSIDKAPFDPESQGNGGSSSAWKFRGAVFRTLSSPVS
jgi:hypothetical protein